MSDDVKRYQVSWLRRYSEQVRLSWWRRALGQRRTRSLWVRYGCVVTLTDHQLKALGGWDAVNTALITPLIQAVGGCVTNPGENYTPMGTPAPTVVMSMPSIVGLQVETKETPTPYIRTSGGGLTDEGDQG